MKQSKEVHVRVSRGITGSIHSYQRRRDRPDRPDRRVSRVRLVRLSELELPKNTVSWLI